MSPEEAAAASLEAEIERRDEWYGLDNWTPLEVAEWVLEAVDLAGFDVVERGEQS